MLRVLFLVAFLSLISLQHTAGQSTTPQDPDTLVTITPGNAAQLTEQRFVGAALPGDLQWLGGPNSYLHLETSLESYDYDVDRLADPALTFEYEGGDPALVRQRDYGADTHKVFNQQYNLRMENGEIVVAIANLPEQPEHILRTGMTSGFQDAVFSDRDGFLSPDSERQLYVALKFAPESYEQWPATVQLWDLNTDRLIAILEQPFDIFETVRFNANNTELVVATAAPPYAVYGDIFNDLRIYNVESGKLIGPESPNAFSPVFIPERATNLIIYHTPSGLGHWNKIERGILECEGEKAEYAPTFSAIRDDSGQSDYRGFFAAANYKNVLIWRYTNSGVLGECFVLQPQQENASYSPRGLAPDLVFSPDTKLLAIGYYDQVDVWDLDQKTLIGTFPTDSLYPEITFSPDSSLIILNTSDQQRVLWNIANHERLSELPADAVFNLDWSRAVSWNGGDLQFIRPMNGQITTLPVIDNYLGQLVGFDHAQHLAIFNDNGEFKLIDLKTGQRLPMGDYLQVNKKLLGDSGTGPSYLEIRGKTYSTSLLSASNGSLISPDQHYLATLPQYYGESPAGSVNLWNLHNKQFLGGWNVGDYGKNAFSFSPDSSLIATGVNDSAIALWDIEASLQQYSPDNRENYGVHQVVFDLPERSDVYQIVFSRNGKWLAAQVETSNYEAGLPPQRRVYVWSVTKALESITPTSTDEEKLITSPDFTFDNIEDVAFVPDSSILLAKDREMDQLGLWDLDTGERLSTFAGNAISAFDPKGYVLVTMVWEDLYVWNVSQLLSGEAFPLKILRGSGKEVMGLSFDPEGEMLFAERPDGVKVFAIDDSITLSETVIQSSIPDHIAITKDNIQDLELLSTFDSGYIASFAISPDQRWLIAGSGTREINGEEFGLAQWDLATGELVRGIGDAKNVYDVMWSPDGQYIATINLEAGGEAGWPVLRLLDFQSGAEQAYLRGRIFADWRMAFDPQGKFIVTLVNSFTSIDGQPGELALWNVDDILKRHDVYNTQANYLQLQQNYIPASTITFMPGTSLFAVAEQNTITLMDETRKPIQTFNGDWDYVSQLIFSPDGSLVVASVEKFIPNSGDGTPDQTEAVGIYIWRTDDGERVKFMPYPSYIGNLAFSPDGSLLVVVDFTGQANIYETLTDRILKTFAVREVTVGQWRGSSTRNLQFNADGTLLISAIGDGIKLWGVKP